MLKKSPKKVLVKILLISFLFQLSSCVTSDIFSKKNAGPAEIRIVDLNGNPRPIQRFVPEGNVQAMAMQKSTQNNFSSQDALGQENPAPNNLSQNNFIAQNQSSVNELAPATEYVQKSPEPDVFKPKATVSYDMSGDKMASSGFVDENTALKKDPAYSLQNFEKKSQAASKKITKTITASNSEKSGSFIQIGSFSVKSNAQETLKDGKVIFNGKIEQVNIGNNKSYRVLLGPISNNKELDNILRKAKNNGYADAFIVK